MRITNNMLIRNMMVNINDNLRRMEKLQYQMATNKKIRVPSDDPIIASRSLKFRTDVSEIEQSKKNTEDAYSWMEMTEAALDNLGAVIHRTRELTVEASNEGTLTPDDKLKIEAEIKQLKRSIVEIGNSTYAGRYIFAGYKTDKPPFEIEETPIGEKITYNGKFLSIGGPVPEDVSDADIQDFYQNNLHRIYGYPEIEMGKYEEITLTEDKDFKISLDGTEYIINLSAGGPKDIDSIISEIEGQAPFSSTPPLIRVSKDSGRIKFTVLDDNIKEMQINNGELNGGFDISEIGLTDGVTSRKDEIHEILYNVGVGNQIRVNLEGSEIFDSGITGLFETFQKLEMALNGETKYKTTNDGITVEENELSIDAMLTELDNDMDRILKTRADIGGRMNYAKMMINRLDDDYLNFTSLKSKNEDADMSEVIINLKSEEYLYRASLSAGARIIQPNLLDFLR